MPPVLPPQIMASLPDFTQYPASVSGDYRGRHNRHSSRNSTMHPQTYPATADPHSAHRPRTQAPYHRESVPVTQSDAMTPIQTNSCQIPVPYDQPLPVDNYRSIPNGAGHMYRLGSPTSTGSYPGPPHGSDTHGSATTSPMESTPSGIEANDLHSGRAHPPETSRRQPTPRRSNRDRSDGHFQTLSRPSSQTAITAWEESDLPPLPTNLQVEEQDQILNAVNDRLSQCAFDFFAKYQFPIVRERDKREVQRPSDREWTEWVYLLERLATKRRIPRRVLYCGQIKQLVTVLENSLEMRHAAKHTSRPPKDDRNVLQLISAGTQVAKMLKDRDAMLFLDRLYANTEWTVYERKSRCAYR